MTNIDIKFLIAGTHSGVGKTTLTAGLIAALRGRGYVVQPFKVGPDYIDPTYHTLAAGRSARNLDTWLIPRERVRELMERASRGADIAIVEGVMGLFDGFSYDNETGSTAEVAKFLRVPTVLVIDAHAMARSAAAVAVGYRHFDRDVPLIGFIVNRVAGEHHGRGVARAIEQATGLPVFGWLPRVAELSIPERHLGLIPTIEPGRWRDFLRQVAETVRRYIDVDALLDAARSAPSHGQHTRTFVAHPLTSHMPANGRAVVAIARDAAFSFFYEDNVELLEDAGAHLRFFSPLNDAEVPPEADVIILSGGFPELYASRLAANRSMLASIREAHRRGVRIYAECGGLMYLTEEIVTAAGERFAMVGLLPGRSIMTQRLTLGYRIAQAAGNSWLFRAGESVRGHEFHYSRWEGRPEDLTPAYYVRSSADNGSPRPEGALLDNVLASYVHLHFWSKPELAHRMVGLGSALPKTSVVQE